MSSEEQQVAKEEEEKTNAENEFRKEKLVEDGKNSKMVMCQKCPSKILNQNMGDFVEKEVSLTYFIYLLTF